jgi:hypothetical protein
MVTQVGGMAWYKHPNANEQERYRKDSACCEIHQRLPLYPLGVVLESVHDGQRNTTNLHDTKEIGNPVAKAICHQQRHARHNNHRHVMHQHDGTFLDVKQSYSYIFDTNERKKVVSKLLSTPDARRLNVITDKSPNANRLTDRPKLKAHL